MGRKPLDVSDFIGSKFNMLTIEAFDHDERDSRGHVKHYVRCRCDCGNTKVMDILTVTSGKITSCGCTRKLFDVSKFINQRFGKLTVIGFDHDEYRGNHVYHYLKCRCDCGNEIVTGLRSLQVGDRKSCGCSRIFDPTPYIGKRYGMLVITGHDHDDPGPPVIHFMNCKCDCGKTSVTNLSHLIQGHTTSCGCKRARDPQSFIGARYGRLVVLGHDHDVYDGPRVRRYVKCICDCGNEIVTNLQLLISGETTSCGCYRNDKVVTHGLSNSRLYRIWDRMKQRCYNPNKDNYKDYGGRGIKICDEWRNDFNEFFRWSMQAGYTDDMSIDRIDPDGDYEPGNCRWATQDVQNRNTRRNVYLSYRYVRDGKKNPKYLTFCITDWATICGITMEGIKYKLKNRNGRSINKILEECYMSGHQTSEREIIISDEIMKYNDPSKLVLSYHD